MSVVSDFWIEVFGVWERILNLNFAGQILNFENLVCLNSSGTPSQRKDSIGAFLDFLFSTVRLRVNSALIRIHLGVLGF